LAETLKHFSV